jgi:hypothetical protein
MPINLKDMIDKRVVVVTVVMMVNHFLEGIDKSTVSIALSAYGNIRGYRNHTLENMLLDSKNRALPRKGLRMSF